MLLKKLGHARVLSCSAHDGEVWINHSPLLSEKVGVATRCLQGFIVGCVCSTFGEEVCDAQECIDWSEGEADSASPTRFGSYHGIALCSSYGDSRHCTLTSTDAQCL